MREYLKNPWFVSLTQLLSESGLASSSNNIFQDFQKHVPIMEEVNPWRFSKMVKEFIKKLLTTTHHKLLRALGLVRVINNDYQRVWAYCSG